MPWCPTCDRFLNPPSVTEDGTCPTCGRALSAHDSLGDAAADALNAKAMKAPWHFKLMIAAIVLYLGFRAVQGIEWLVR